VSAKNHPRLVGVFVLGAIVLTVAAIAAVSGSDWFVRKDYFSVFFPGSVKGLNPGAPVTFRGVKIGEVRTLNAYMTGREDLPIEIEVVLELRDNVVKVPPGVTDTLANLDTAELAAALIGRGVRARMLSQSLLTGQRYIEVDFLPGEPARYGSSALYPQLPTAPTALEKLGAQAEGFLDKIAELPLDEMLEDVRGAIKGLRELLVSDKVQTAFTSINRSLRTLEPVMVEAKTTLADADALFLTLDSEVAQTAGEARQTSKELRETLARASEAMSALERTLATTDRTQLEATKTLMEMADTLAVLNQFVEYLQTHPEAIVIGKPPQEDE